MQYQGLGWQSGKIGGKSATKNSENTPQYIKPIIPISQKSWDMLKKIHHRVSVVRG